MMRLKKKGLIGQILLASLWTVNCLCGGDLKKDKNGKIYMVKSPLINFIIRDGVVSQAAKVCTLIILGLFLTLKVLPGAAEFTLNKLNTSPKNNHVSSGNKKDKKKKDKDYMSILLSFFNKYNRFVNLYVRASEEEIQRLKGSVFIDPVFQTNLDKIRADITSGKVVIDKKGGKIILNEPGHKGVIYAPVR